MNSELDQTNTRAVEALSLMESDHSQYTSLYGERIPVKVQIAADQFYLIPQYPDTELYLIQILIRSLYTDIPESQSLYLVNWTKGPLIGKSVEPTTTLQEMLEGSQQKVPVLRLYWNNCKKLCVEVDIHDILIITYNKVSIFDYLRDVLDSISKDIKKQFKLDRKTVFDLTLEEQFKKMSPLSFVGRFFRLHGKNKLKVLVSFKECLSKNFVIKYNKGKFEHLVCPISQLIMQDPVQTSCRHVFDRLCISLSVMKDGRCPVCRHPLDMNDVKSYRKFKNEIIKLQRQRIRLMLAETSVKKEEEIQK